MKKNEELIYILGIILIVSVLFNIYFIYKIQSGAYPPANFQLNDKPTGQDNSLYLSPDDISY